jgi:hypothetical protein
MVNIVLKFFQWVDFSHKLLISVLPTNKSRKDLNRVILEATVIDLQLIRRRLHLMHPLNCSHAYCHIFMHKMPAWFFFISRFIKEVISLIQCMEFIVFWKNIGPVLTAHRTPAFNHAMGLHEQHDDFLCSNLSNYGRLCNYLYQTNPCWNKCTFWSKNFTEYQFLKRPTALNSYFPTWRRIVMYDCIFFVGKRP